MNVHVKLFLTGETKEINLEKKSKISDLLTKIGYKPDTVVVLKDKKPVPIDYEIKDNEKLKILKVSSGG